MADVDDTSSTKPHPSSFWDDDQTAPNNGAPATQNMMFGAPVPTSVFIGQLPSDAHTNPQLTGEVSSMNNSMFAFSTDPLPAQQRFAWSQFFVGLFAPFILIFLLAVISEYSQPDYSDAPQFWRSQSVTIVKDDDGWFNLSVEKSAMESVNFWSSVQSSEQGEVGISFSFDPINRDWERNGVVLQSNYSYSTYDYSEKEIGRFYDGNQTIWFELSGVDRTSMLLDVQYYDSPGEQAWYDEHRGSSEIIGILAWLGGVLGYIVATVMSFTKGKKALGIGLLSAIPFGVIMLPVLFILLLILFGF